jgi:hypothetical protein
MAGRRLLLVGSPWATLVVWAALAAGAAVAEPAGAARVVDVRVGRHPDFVRVVFETDAPVRFSLDPTPDPEGQVLVRLDAESRVLVVTAPGDPSTEVRLEPGTAGGTVARIHSDVPVRIESQVLEHPPRVVLDLRPGQPEEPPAGPSSGLEEPPPVAEAAPSPAPESPEIPPPPPATVSEPAANVSAPAGEPAANVSPPPSEPEAKAPPPESEPEAKAPPPESEPETPPLPPVSAPPPATPEDVGPEVARRFALDDRALALLLTGGIVGLFLGIVLAAPWWRRRIATAPEVEPTAPTTSAPELAAPAAKEDSSAEAPPSRRDDELVGDLLTMIQGLERRLGRVEGERAELREETARVASRLAAQGQELEAQRMALARIERALRRGAMGRATTTAAQPVRPPP